MMINPDTYFHITPFPQASSEEYPGLHISRLHIQALQGDMSRDSVLFSPHC